MSTSIKDYLQEHSNEFEVLYYPNSYLDFFPIYIFSLMSNTCMFYYEDTRDEIVKLVNRLATSGQLEIPDSTDFWPRICHIIHDILEYDVLENQSGAKVKLQFFSHINITNENGLYDQGTQDIERGYFKPVCPLRPKHLKIISDRLMLRGLYNFFNYNINIINYEDSYYYIIPEFRKFEGVDNLINYIQLRYDRLLDNNAPRVRLEYFNNHNNCVRNLSQAIDVFVCPTINNAEHIMEYQLLVEKLNPKYIFIDENMSICFSNYIQVTAFISASEQLVPNFVLPAEVAQYYVNPRALFKRM